MAGEWGWMGEWHDLAKINGPQLVLLSTAIVLGIRKTLVSNPFLYFIAFLPGSQTVSSTLVHLLSLMICPPEIYFWKQMSKQKKPNPA